MCVGRQRPRWRKWFSKRSTRWRLTSVMLRCRSQCPSRCLNPILSLLVQSHTAASRERRRGRTRPLRSPWRRLFQTLAEVQPVLMLPSPARPTVALPGSDERGQERNFQLLQSLPKLNPWLQPDLLSLLLIPHLHLHPPSRQCRSFDTVSSLRAPHAADVAGLWLLAVVSSADGSLPLAPSRGAVRRRAGGA